MPAGEEAPPGEEALARRHVVALVCVARAIRAQCPVAQHMFAGFCPWGLAAGRDP